MCKVWAAGVGSLVLNRGCKVGPISSLELSKNHEEFINTQTNCITEKDICINLNNHCGRMPEIVILVPICACVCEGVYAAILASE